MQRNEDSEKVIRDLNRYHLLLCIFFVLPAGACELTEEYTQFSDETMSGFNDSYKECVTSVIKAQYWFRVAQCIKAGDGANVGGGCEHMVGNPTLKYRSPNFGNDFCSVLNSTSNEAHIYIELVAKARGIKKCQ